MIESQLGDFGDKGEASLSSALNFAMSGEMLELVWSAYIDEGKYWEEESTERGQSHENSQEAEPEPYLYFLWSDFFSGTLVI